MPIMIKFTVKKNIYFAFENLITILYRYMSLEIVPRISSNLIRNRDITTYFKNILFKRLFKKIKKVKYMKKNVKNTIRR